MGPQGSPFSVIIGGLTLGPRVVWVLGYSRKPSRRKKKRKLAASIYLCVVYKRFDSWGIEFQILAAGELGTSGYGGNSSVSFI